MNLAQLSIRSAAFVLIHSGTAMAVKTVRIANGQRQPFTSDRLPHGELAR